MLRMKRNWVIQGAGFVVTAALLAGCQTGQKSDSMAFAEKFPTYGMDVQEEGRADGGRAPASVVGPLVDMLKAASNPVIAKGAKRSVEGFQMEILTHIRSTPDGKALAKRLKKDPSKLTLKDLEEMTDVKAQLRVVESFMSTRTSNPFSANSSFVAQTNVAIKKAQLGLEYQKSAGSGLLTSRGKGSLNFDAAVYEKVATAKAIDLDEVLSPLSLREEFKTAAGQQTIRDTKDLAGRVHNVTKHSYFIRETCDNIDLAALESYNDMLRAILKQMDEPVPGGGGKLFKHCKNIVEIEAVAVANFQVGLAREGRMAWVAVEEMGTCKFVPPGTAAEAGRKLASNADVPKTPTCN